MKEKSQTIRMLLVVAMLCLGVNVTWATDVASYDFEDETYPFTGVSRQTLSVTDDATLSSKVFSFATNSDSYNRYALAEYSFKSSVNDAATVSIEFDLKPSSTAGNHWINIGDATLRSETANHGGFATRQLGFDGVIFRIGTARMSVNSKTETVFAVNDEIVASSVTTKTASDVLNHWVHVEIIVNNVTKKVSYTVKLGSETLATAANVAFYKSAAERCSQIDIASISNSISPVLMDNLAITKTVSETKHSFTVNAVTDGSTIAEIGSGEAGEGALYGCYIPYVVSKEGKFYVKDDANVSSYYFSAYMGNANQVKTVNYTLDEGIVGYTEGVGSTYRNVVGSNNASYSGGDYINNSSVSGNPFNAYNRGFDLGTLPAGFYQLVAYVVNSENSRSVALRNITSNETAANPIVTITNSNKITGELTANFSLTSSTPLRVNGANNTNNSGRTLQCEEFDYVLVRKLSQDATFKISNPDMETEGSGTAYWQKGVKDWNPCTTVSNYRQLAFTSAQNPYGAFTSTNAYENWTNISGGLVGQMSQTITDLPDGIYKVSLAALVNKVNGEFVYGKSNDVTYQVPLTGATEIAYDYSVFATVSGGSLEIGLDMNGSGVTWAAIDNARLAYYGASFSDDDINAILAAVPTDPMLVATKTALTGAKTTFEGSTTVANANLLLAAINNANRSVEAYAPLGTKLAEAASVRASVVANNPSYLSTYDSNIATITTNYNNGSIAEADIAAQVAAVEADILALVKSQTNNGSDMTRLVANADGSANPVTGWTIETALADGELFQYDGHSGTASGMSVPFVEYWHAGNGTNLSTNKISQTITGLQNGKYTVTATTFVNNEYRASNSDPYTAPSTGSALLFANNETTDITTGGTTTSFNGNMGTFSVEVEVTNGTLELGVKTVSPNYNWIGFKDVKLTYYSGVVIATIGSTGYTTFASSYPLDLSNLPKGITAYTASVVGESEVTFTPATTAVAAGTGLLLKGTVNTSYDIPVVASGETISGNKMIGCPTATDITPSESYYVLVNNDGTAEFHPLSGTYTDNKVTIPAGKAYLDVNAGTARALSIALDNEEVTGINTIQSSGVKVQGCYNLNGQRVAQPAKGLYIINGRKVVVK